ncbi:Insect cuticle protein,Chitin-binding type R&R consensus [Cinara cedri]|uniref:Insect cuticle protein,Chitin-binding type R&R consensus n=1 Tax=Cinara cedri TaxID=506608 RepID=A0A5E4NMJ9_9HEMI|nr:Insect cuticle protein,Chitin-binding type R&R consensus [Cinara cedri]
MQVTLVLSSLLLAAAAVSAFPQSPESRAAILRQDTEVNYDGTYKNKFETENGIKQDEVGYLKAGPSGTPISVVQGSSSYVAPDGSVINTGYVADENGYRPVGSHLPVPPPIPVEIQESLKLLASLPSTPEPVYQ